MLLRERQPMELPRVDEARALTDDRIKIVRERLARGEVQSGVSTCLFGSWARKELTDESDDDWAVLVADPLLRMSAG